MAKMLTQISRLTLGSWIVISLTAGIGAAEPASTQPQKQPAAKMSQENATPSLPFAWDVTQKESPWWRSDRENRLFDCGFRQVIIDGELWFMYVKWQDLYTGKCRVMRHKGPDLDHLERQPDGFIDAPNSGFLGVGLWFDDQTRILYTLLHTEVDPIGQQGWCTKKTRMAMSKDLGLTWAQPVDVLTRAVPKTEDYEGSYFEAGPADFDFYTDVKGGYFYVTCWNAFVAKKGKMNFFVGYNEVARCAIADKMAPGKWFKFRDGTWTEPGMGGKASRVGFNMRGIYGNTIYSTYLNKYLRIGIQEGFADKRFAGSGFTDGSICISACTDLAKQDWLPMARLFYQPTNEVIGFVLSDEKGFDPSTCGKTLRAYNFWDWRSNNQGDRVLTITLKEGSTPSKYLPPHDSYTYEPHPESGDRIESRKTKIVGAFASEVQYAGEGWTAEQNEHYYQSQAKTAAKPGQSVQFGFRGEDIYWRAVAGPDAGKADVFVDDVLEKTVDLYFQECALPYQFAFIKTGLSPERPHTIKIVVRGDKNPDSSGAMIRHIAFEYAPVDDVPPTLVAAAPHQFDRVVLTFSEPVQQVDAALTSNYRIEPNVKIVSAVPGADSKTVTLTTSPLATSSLSSGGEYTLTVKNIRDCARKPNTIAADTSKTFRYSPLVARWKLDDGKGSVATDASGSKLDGALKGIPVWTNMDGRAGLSLDGVDDIVEIPTRLETLAVPFSFSLWVNPAAVQVEYADILGNHGGLFQGLVMQQEGVKTNLFGFGYGDGKQFRGPGLVQLTAGQWQHVAVVCDREKACFYLNGELKSSAPCTGAFVPNPDLTFRLGQGFGAGRFFRGLLSDVRIYRTALSVSDVQAVMKE